VWTWTAIYADSKLVPSWLVGLRNADYAKVFVADLAERFAGRVQLTTEGLKLYVNAVVEAFGSGIDRHLHAGEALRRR
jgi:transposase-like protein